MFATTFKFCKEELNKFIEMLRKEIYSCYTVI